MKRKLILLLACLLFLGGLAIMLLPTIRSEMLRQSEHVAIQLFEQYRNEAQALASPQPAQTSQAETEPQVLETERPFPGLWEACQAYNEALRKEQKYTAYGMEQPAIDLSDYGWELETFATLTIPAAEIETPVYLGTNRANLQRGAALLGGSSLPTGGEGTHCVICGHRTWHGIVHPFIGLEQVQPGDRVTLTNPWEELSYYVENSHPAIISRETFDRVQEELARRNSKRKVKQVGTKTASGKYSSKYALTELLVCGCCGTPYRRCTWAKNGKKRIVWRCISRLDYGKKYCPESLTVDEDVLHQAIVQGLCSIAADTAELNAVEALKQHVGIYFSGGDSTAMDELRIKELVAQITAEAAKGSYSKEMAALVQELNTLKQRVAQKKPDTKRNSAVKARLEEAAQAISNLRPEHIEYSDDIVRQVIDCVRVLSSEKTEITFKGGAKRKVPLSPQ